MRPPTVSQDASAVVCLPLLEQLRHGSLAWDQLLKRSPAASPFAGWAWHWAWANSAPPEDVRTSQAVLLRGAGGALKALPWDVVVLSNLAPDATNATRLAAALTRRGCAIRREALRSCPYLEL